MLAQPIQSDEALRDGRDKAEENFREKRLKEDPDLYHQYMDDYQGEVADLLELTVDLTDLDNQGFEVVTKKPLFQALRYLTGPPVSKDDLNIVAEVESFNKVYLKANPKAVNRIMAFVRATIDRRRFPWLVDGREADEQERNNAVMATAALMASQKLATLRRTKAKEDQEQEVDDALIASQFQRVANRRVQTFADAPKPGEFCRESLLGRRKADFVVCLWDNRIMPIECKVSNSSTNSVKRLNNDAAVKAMKWIEAFGRDQVVPAAVLSGVYKLHNLIDAQDKNLTLFWEHDLAAMIDWIAKTKSTK
ncbi:MAG: restriction endonuclease [Phycisphaerales bacterium]|nr:restriction endonuclease [Phycisphaerales bacterium]